MERLSTRLRTWFPNAPWPTPWRSPREDGATDPGAGMTPVGYLVNQPAGLAGSQGIGFDYVVGSGGLYVQSESAHLTARILVAPADVRGLAPVSEKLALAHGPIPAGLFEAGLRWFLETPDTERFFAVGWDGMPTGWRFPRRPERPPLSPTSRPPGRWPSSTPTAATAPSSRPPTMGTSRAFASTASWDASMTPCRNLPCGWASTATSPRWNGRRSSTARSRRDCGWRAKGPNQHQATNVCKRR